MPDSTDSRAASNEVETGQPEVAKTTVGDTTSNFLTHGNSTGVSAEKSEETSSATMEKDLSDSTAPNATPEEKTSRHVRANQGVRDIESTSSLSQGNRCSSGLSDIEKTNCLPTEKSSHDAITPFTVIGENNDFERPGVASKDDSKQVVSTPDGESSIDRQFARWWLDQVDTSHGDLMLLACCLVQGLLDCTAFKNWAAFIGMQTGNTVILCLSTADLPAGQPWAFGTTLISIVSFFVGCFFATRISTLLVPTRRFTFTMNFVVQTALIAAAAALVTGNVVLTDADETPNILLGNKVILIGVAPLAFQSGMTIATSRMIGLGNEIPVTVYTSTYAALAGDPKLFQMIPISANRGRNRRLAAVVCIFAGALVSTWLEVRSIGMDAILWMAAGIKLVLVGVSAFILPRKQPPKAETTRA